MGIQKQLFTKQSKQRLQMKKLILDMPFVTLNEYIDAERSHRQKAAKIKKQQTDSVYYLSRSQKIQLPVGRYDIVFTWIKPNNRQDHDNISFSKKFILDGIVKARILPNDNPAFVGNFQDKFVLMRSRSRISCEVEFILHT